MTTEHPAASPGAGEEPHAALAAERARIARLRAEAARRSARVRLRRRAVLPAAVCSGVLAGTGLLAAWARHSEPLAVSATTPSTLTQTTDAAGALAQLQQDLAADKAAIAGLAQTSGASAPAAGPSGAAGASASASSGAQASAASGAGSGPQAAPAAAGTASPSVAAAPAPTVTIATLPPISIPTVQSSSGAGATAPTPIAGAPAPTTTTAPPTHGTTGASGAG